MGDGVGPGPRARATPGEPWIFGYGSLIWRPDFPWIERVPASISGWARRFWQHSTDHRGTPELPGRVVTLVPEPAATCHGMAYRIAPEQLEAIAATLDHREKGGYARHRVSLHLSDGRIAPAGLVYVASTDNPSYAGPAPAARIAERILASVGPSGPNVEYLLRLDEALAEMGASDPHVAELARRVRDLGGLR